MKLEPGFYKVEIKGDHFGTYHYLRVFNNGKKLFCQFDNAKVKDITGTPFYLDHIRILKKYDVRSFPLPQKAMVDIRIQDEDGDLISIHAFNVEQLRDVFSKFPWVAQKLGVDGSKKKNKS